MLHLKAKKLLAAYLDGELDEKLRQDLEKHLPACAKCRAELESYKEFSARVHELSPVESKPEPFWQTRKIKSFRACNNLNQQ
jgi:protein TonB